MDRSELWWDRDVKCCKSRAKLPRCIFSPLRGHLLPSFVCGLTSLWPLGKFFGISLVSIDQKAEDNIRHHLRPIAEISLLPCDPPTLCTHQSTGKFLIHDFLCSVTMQTSWNCYHVRMQYLGNLKLYFLTRVTLNCLQNKPSLLFLWAESCLCQYSLKSHWKWTIPWQCKTNKTWWWYMEEKRRAVSEIYEMMEKMDPCSCLLRHVGWDPKALWFMMGRNVSRG